MAVTNPYNKSQQLADEYEKAKKNQQEYEAADAAANRERLEELKAQYGIEQGRKGDTTDAYEHTHETDVRLKDTLQRRLDALRAQQRGAFTDESRAAVNAITPERLAAETVDQGPRPEFDRQRERFLNVSRAGARTAEDAMTRRFAAMGNLNSGAAIKQAQISQDQLAQTENAGLSDINAQEAGAIRQSEEAAKARNAVRQQYNSDQEFRASIFKFEANSKLAQFDMAVDQSDWQKKLDEYNQQLNQKMIEMSEPSTFDKIIGGVGAIGGLVGGVGGLIGGLAGKK